jgi:pimeloyl-ACP methyl ester carboxylesterase
MPKTLSTHFLRQGGGEAVILIHGVGMDASIWAPQIAALSRGYDVIAYDMLGHGGSALPPVEPRLADYAGQLLALLDTLGIDAAHIIGHSMGALVALEFALTYPLRTRSLIAMNAVYRRTAEQRAAVVERAAALTRDGKVDANGATLARWFGEPIPAGLTTAAAAVEELLAAVDPVGYARTYALFARSDDAHCDRLDDLACPALFLTGEEDPNSTPKMSAAMAVATPHGRCQVLPGERHMMAVAAPQLVNQRLLAFLAEVAS